MKWWQTSIFKAGLWALGIAVGAYWHSIFSGVLPELVAVAVVCLGYITYLWIKQ
jgi:hypothetical protein